MEQTGSGLLLDIAWVCKIKGTSRYFDKGIYLGHWLWKWHLSKHIFCWMSPLGHLVSSSVLPFPALVIICLTTIPCFNPLTIGRMKPVSNQLLEMGRDRPNYTSTCTFFLSLKLSLWAVRRKFPGSKIPRGRLSQWAQMYSVNLRMLSSTPHHNP